MVFFGDILAYT